MLMDWVSKIPFSGTKEAFLGTIEPGNDGPAVFTLQADRPGVFNYTLTVDYTDDYGMHTTRQALQMVVTKPDSTPMIAVAAVILVIVAIVLVYWYRRRKEE